MTRVELEHVLRAAAAITGHDEIVVVGTQAILGQYPEAPSELRVSKEADIYTPSDPATDTLIEGALGEGSKFHETYDYYADGVGPGTAKLPEGWEDRMIEISNENTRGARGMCLEIHDFAISKYYAGREKDLRFTRHLAEYGLTKPRILEERLGRTPIEESERDRIRKKVRKDFEDVRRIRPIGDRIRRHGAGAAGNVRGRVDREGVITLVWKPEDEGMPGTDLGQVYTGREMALAMMYGGAAKADEIPQWERNLEKERQELMIQAQQKAAEITR